MKHPIRFNRENQVIEEADGTTICAIGNEAKETSIQMLVFLANQSVSSANSSAAFRIQLERLLESFTNEDTVLDYDEEIVKSRDLLYPDDGEPQDGRCTYCGKPTNGAERVCGPCYAQFTPATLNDLDQ